MKLLVFMNMPAGSASLGTDDPAGYITHQIILDVPLIDMFSELAEYLPIRGGYLMGEHLIYERMGREKVWKRRGPMLINMAHVGKIAPYYEGGSR